MTINLSVINSRATLVNSNRKDSNKHFFFANVDIKIESDMSYEKIIKKTEGGVEENTQMYYTSNSHSHDYQIKTRLPLFTHISCDCLHFFFIF